MLRLFIFIFILFVYYFDIFWIFRGFMLFKVEYFINVEVIFNFLCEYLVFYGVLLYFYYGSYF